jgi:hypothetical protein
MATRSKRSVGRGVSFDTVRLFALALDGVEEGTSYCTPAFKRKGKLFLRLWEDHDTLVVRVDPERRDEMVAADPDVYFVTDHYLNYPWILVRLSKIRADALQDLINTAWQLAAKKKPSSQH